MAGPLDKKKDEEMLFNKAARPCQATISPQGLPEMRERERAETSREVWRCEVAKEEERE